MARNHFSPGKFRVQLNVPGPPVFTCHFVEVEWSDSPQAAGWEALRYWQSDEWPGPVELANSAEVFRYAENGELQREPSFNFPLSKSVSPATWLNAPTAPKA